MFVFFLYVVIEFFNCLMFLECDLVVRCFFCLVVLLIFSNFFLSDCVFIKLFLSDLIFVEIFFRVLELFIVWLIFENWLVVGVVFLLVVVCFFCLFEYVFWRVSNFFFCCVFLIFSLFILFWCWILLSFLKWFISVVIFLLCLLVVICVLFCLFV